MQYQMWVTGASACDYFGYNPNFKPSFYKQRFYPDTELFAKFEAGVEAGTQMLDNGLKMLEGKLEEQEKFIEEKPECPEIKNIEEATNEFFEKAIKKEVANDFPF